MNINQSIDTLISSKKITWNEISNILMQKL